MEPSLTLLNKQRDCCKIPDNLELIPSGNKDLEVYQCMVCHAKHYGMVADKGLYGLHGAALIQQAVINECIINVNYTCKCAPDNRPQTIRGIDLACFCQTCKTIYRITNVSFDIKSGQMQVTIDQFGKHNG